MYMVEVACVLLNGYGDLLIMSSRLQVALFSHSHTLHVVFYLHQLRLSGVIQHCSVEGTRSLLKCRLRAAAADVCHVDRRTSWSTGRRGGRCCCPAGTSCCWSSASGTSRCPETDPTSTSCAPTSWEWVMLSSAQRFSHAAYRPEAGWGLQVFVLFLAARDHDWMGQLLVRDQTTHTQLNTLAA